MDGEAGVTVGRGGEGLEVEVEGGMGGVKGDEWRTLGVAPYTDPLLGGIGISLSLLFFSVLMSGFRLKISVPLCHAFGQALARAPSGICRADDIPE